MDWNIIVKDFQTTYKPIVWGDHTLTFNEFTTYLYAIANATMLVILVFFERFSSRVVIG